MSKHNETGIKGEAIALKFLQKNDYRILECNWRYEKKEIDIIALYQNILVFVEVKTRSVNAIAPPEASVTPKKQALLKIAAQAYLCLYENNYQVRFDVISIHVHNGQLIKIDHFQNAF
jgi:putative endonuclease